MLPAVGSSTKRSLHQVSERKASLPAFLTVEWSGAQVWDQTDSSLDLTSST